MINTLREIEKAHEAKYKMDEELRFKVRCRRDKLFGLWAAEQMGMSREHTQAYVKDLVRLHIQEAGDDVAKHRVINDFEKSGVGLKERDVAAALTRFSAMAIEQLAGEFPTALARDHSQVGG